MQRVDLIVLGGGAAALAAARAARRRGASVALITEGPPGGDCTFNGCVPSKTLLAAGDVSFADAMTRVRRTVLDIAAEEDENVLAGEGIEVIRGFGEATAPGSVQVAGRIVLGRKLVLATGSAPLVPALPGLDQVPYLTNESLFALTTAPRHLVVLGGGAIGCEMALAMRRLGVAVTMLESADRLLGKEEPAASQVILDALEQQGVVVRLASTVLSVAPAQDGVQLHTATGPLDASHLLVAVGRRPVTAGSEALGLRRTRAGAIEVDLRMRTSVRGVFAAGDVTGRLPFTHAADEMGRVAAGNALGRVPMTFKESAVPWVTFTDPEVARIGLTESQAAARLRGARVVQLSMAEVDRARTAGRTRGFVKIVVAPRRGLGNVGGGRIVGATIVAERAGEMLAEIALAVRTAMLPGRLAQTSHAYPTWSVAVQQTVGQLFGVGAHQPRPAEVDR